jgi:hypothetical protein
VCERSGSSGVVESWSWCIGTAALGVTVRQARRDGSFSFELRHQWPSRFHLKTWACSWIYYLI